jgi:2-polyprenyl-3-methyl-5-hydroxy-6-metoxy-1,4-benzoquinol methylase
MGATPVKLPAATCEICDSGMNTAFEMGQGYSYMRCTSCATLWLKPMPSEATLTEYYDRGEFYDSALDRAAIQRTLAQRRLKVIERATQGRTLLDIGCATGIFLEEARNRGFDVTGFERSLTLAKRAASNGLRILQGPDISALNSYQRFDAVCLWEVIEHVRDPVALLSAAATRLEKGGVLAVSTPNGGSILARLLGRRFPFALVPEHLALYSRSAMRSMFLRSGLVPFGERTFSGLGIDQSRSTVSRRCGHTAVVFAPCVAVGFALIDAVRQGTEFEMYGKKSEGAVA